MAVAIKVATVYWHDPSDTPCWEWFIDFEHANLFADWLYRHRKTSGAVTVEVTAPFITNAGDHEIFVDWLNENARAWHGKKNTERDEFAKRFSDDR